MEKWHRYLLFFLGGVLLESLLVALMFIAELLRRGLIIETIFFAVILSLELTLIVLNRKKFYEVYRGI